MEKGMISVDRWAKGSQAYFLTHLHADHTGGLSPTWKNGPLFCSKITAKLFPPKFPGFKLSLLRVLEIGHWHTLSLVTPSSGSESTVEVLAIDAHHCPGSVMYLFRGDFGCMLFTGDFRWEKTSERAHLARTMLLSALRNEKIHTLYLDNTYCNPSYSFPSREIAAQQVVNIITSYPEHDIIIGIDSLGKEDLLVFISRVLKIKIWVWPERLQTMHLLGFDDIFTTKTSLTRVRAVPRYSFSIETLEGLNAMRPTIGIMASGLPWVLRTAGDIGKPSTSSIRHIKSNGNTDGSISPNNIKLKRRRKIVERYHRYIYRVQYSDHSCYTEIEEFVKLLHPTNVIGIVSSSRSYVDPHYYLGHLCGGNQVSSRINQKLFSKEDEKRNHACDPFTEGKRKRRFSQIDFLGVRISRVSILRKEKRGAKLVDFDSSSD